ncbi:MAG TPA: acetyl-CoA carboxylase biotin carboxyl carrier protein [Thermoanaerobaculia bacterium]|nr:acetyl-CoA carboxylase biotin carboxyl carrier protein [Thermoanaerobaculia bacterium]
MLSFKEIKDLIDLVSERGLSALEVEQTGFRIRIEGARPVAEAAQPSVKSGNGSGQALPEARPGPAAIEISGPSTDQSLHVITSPIVGTFYRAPSPEADPFAEIGQRVSKGKVLCIIESMKLMNEIESDVEGEIVEVYPRSGQPVEYGEKLFAIRLAA